MFITTKDVSHFDTDACGLPRERLSLKNITTRAFGWLARIQSKTDDRSHGQPDLTLESPVDPADYLALQDYWREKIADRAPRHLRGSISSAGW